MKILVATDQWSPDVVGGSARVAGDTARALARRGHDVVVISPAHPHRPEVDVESDSGVEIRRILFRGPLPQTLADPLSTCRHMRSLRRTGFDVVLAHQATNATGAALARLDAPLAVVFHASAVLEMRYVRRRAPWASRPAMYALEPALVVLERIALRRAAGVLVLSRFSEELVRLRDHRAAERVHLVGGGVPEVFFSDPGDIRECRARHGIPPGIVLFTARRLEPRMGVDLLIDALSRIHDDRIVLAVAGTGSLRGALERQVESLGLGRRVRMLGHVPEEELRALYAAADLFVLPTVAYEGFGMATVEALASGTPALGTAVGATPEIVGELGDQFLVAAAQPEALAQGIRSVVPLLGPELRRRARALAEARYHWSAVIVRWEQALVRISRIDD